ncbi:MAG: hypothetical protein A2107_10185 [Verrucomicrobia bacterium GWF2_62_7]|nr:MAG: hypothetical protein A2107_10185 [Verrucomicrobia bacterium GWF2_62_7]
MKMTIAFTKMLVLASLMMSTGCGTYVASQARNESDTYIFTPGFPKGPYSGVRTDAGTVLAAVANPVEHPGYILFAPFVLADIPCSAIADTCMLPTYIK